MTHLDKPPDTDNVGSVVVPYVVVAPMTQRRPVDLLHMQLEVTPALALGDAMKGLRA